MNGKNVQFNCKGIVYGHKNFFLDNTGQVSKNVLIILTFLIGVSIPKIIIKKVVPTINFSNLIIKLKNILFKTHKKYFN